MKDQEGFTIEGPVNKGELTSEIKSLVSRANELDARKDDFVNHEMIARKANELKEKYPDFDEYEIYHLLMGTRPVSNGNKLNIVEKFDFPGEDSVEKFLRSLDMTPDKETVATELQELVNAVMNRNYDEMEAGQEKIVEKIKKLRLKYPDYEDYRLYHIISGSSPFTSSAKFDFPGEDSLEQFIRTL